jgi:hypothetical protein
MEEFRVIEHHSDYEVSNLGNVRDRHTKVDRHKIMAGFGYYQVKLGGTRNYSIHNLVAECFIGPKPGPNYRVDHIDSNKINNNASNLRYLTHSENVSRSKMIGRQPVFYEGELWLMRKLAKANYPQALIGKMFKCTQSMVSHVKNEERPYKQS